MRLVYLGLWKKLVEARNAWRFNVNRRMATQVTSVVLGLLVAMAISTTSRMALHQGTSHALVVLGGNIAALTMLTVVFTFGRALNDLFLARDFEVLAATPLSLQGILVARMSDMAISNLPMALVFALPTMAILTPLAASGLFLPMGLVLVALQVATITAVSSLALLALTTIAPPRFLRQAVYVVWTVGFLGFYLWANVRMGPQGTDLVTPFLRLNQSPLAVLSVWTTRGTTHFFLGNLRGGFRDLLFMLALALITVLISARYLAESTITGRAAFTENGQVRPRGINTGVFALLPASLRAIAQKELLTFTRDIRELTGILYALTLVILFALRMPNMGGAVGFSVITAALFAGNFQIRTTLSAFGREGKNWLLLQAAPLSPRELVLAKFAVWSSVSGFSSGLLALSLGMFGGHGPIPLLFIASSGLCVGVVAAAVAIRLGAKYADFEAERPEEYVSSAGKWAALATTLAVAAGSWLITRPIESLTAGGLVLSFLTLFLATAGVTLRELKASERIVAEALEG